MFRFLGLLGFKAFLFQSFFYLTVYIVCILCKSCPDSWA